MPPPVDPQNTPGGRPMSRESNSELGAKDSDQSAGRVPGGGVGVEALIPGGPDAGAEINAGAA
eukprot:11084537-Alexandrium_andersonii.AAC.1